MSDRALLANPTTVAYTGTAGRLGPLAEGEWYVWGTTACYMLRGGDSVTATSSSTPADAEEKWKIRVTGTHDAYVSFIQQSAGGNGLAERVK